MGKKGSNATPEEVGATKPPAPPGPLKLDAIPVWRRANGTLVVGPTPTFLPRDLLTIHEWEFEVESKDLDADGEVFLRLRFLS